MNAERFVNVEARCPGAGRFCRTGFVRQARKDEAMPQYLVAIHHPDDFDPASESAATRADISALNREMIAAGVRVFAGGLESPAAARSIRQSGGSVYVTDGPYIEAKEHIGGFWILEVAGLEDALAWGRKAAVACRAPVEVRAFG
jgi:hypothetical protein